MFISEILELKVIRQRILALSLCICQNCCPFLFFFIAYSLKSFLLLSLPSKAYPNKFDFFVSHFQNSRTIGTEQGETTIVNCTRSLRQVKRI